MKRALVIGLIVSLFSAAWGDTFRHKETGEVFYGFQTQKRSGGKLLVYNSDEKKSQTIIESEYEITLDGKGRRNSIIRVLIRQPEALLSKAISDRIAQSIVDASNSGPQLIVVEIDSPGGRGEYMRTIASAIEQTTNCPTAAYITGGDYSGAYSAAAVIALACDAVYMAPTSAIGAVGPMTGAITNEQYAAHLNLYSADTLAGYSGYVMGLVRTDELRLVARALVDKSVKIVEVVDAADGRTKFVERDNRQPTQTIVRTLSEGVPAGAYRLPTGEAAQGPLPAEVIGRVLTLTASEAVRIGLADKVVSSLKEIAVVQDIPDAQFTNAPDIGPTIRQYSAARRNIGQSLSTIERLEDYASTLEEQIIRVEDLLRTGTVTREVSRSTPPAISRRGRVSLPFLYDEYYGVDLGGTMSTRDQTRRALPQGSRSRRQTAETERFTTDQPNVSLEMLRLEQTAVLRELVAEYRRAINLARRWPGALPSELPIQVLESNMNSAAALLDYILRYPVQTYQQPQPQQNPTQRGTRR